MSGFQPKQKDRRKVKVPDELRESLREVFELIQEAKNDPDIELDYDDAIQVGVVCGGRYGKKSRPYVLTYYPRLETESGKWYLKLHRNDIEDIGEGRLAEIVMYCCTTPECGCKFREADQYCSECDYVDDPKYGTFTFPEAESRLELLGIVGFSENSTPAVVIEVLGSPDETGGGEVLPPLGFTWPWIKYFRSDCQLRFEFSKSKNRIRNISLMEKDWKPGE